MDEDIADRDFGQGERERLIEAWGDVRIVDAENRHPDQFFEQEYQFAGGDGLRLFEPLQRLSKSRLQVVDFDGEDDLS